MTNVDLARFLTGIIDDMRIQLQADFSSEAVRLANENLIIDAAHTRRAQHEINMQRIDGGIATLNRMGEVVIQRLAELPPDPSAK